MDMNFILSIVIFIFFISMIIKSVLGINKLLIKEKSTRFEKFIVGLSCIVIAIITVVYGKTVFHYLIGIAGDIMLITTWLNQGIREDGFVVWYRSVEIITWEKVRVVTIRASKSTKVELTGKFMKKCLRFDIGDYDKVFKTIQDNIPYYAEIKVMKYESISL